MDFVDFISSKANQSGWKITKVISESLVMLTFDADHGKENVYIKPCGKDANGNTVLEFSSSGIPLADDISVNETIGLELLRRNGAMLSGYWGIESVSGKEVFSVFASQIAQTMDKDEFEAAVRGILNEIARFHKVAQKNSISF